MTKDQRDPNGIRTHVTAVRGRCPEPLDDRVTKAGSSNIQLSTVPNRARGYAENLEFFAENRGLRGFHGLRADVKENWPGRPTSDRELGQVLLANKTARTDATATALGQC